MNTLLHSPVTDIPVVRTIGSQVSLINTGEMSAFNVLSLDELENSYEDNSEEIYADGSEDKMDIDDGILHS